MAAARIVAMICAHAIVTGATLWHISALQSSLSVRLVTGALVAAILLPWLQTLAAGRAERYVWLALLLVFVVGVGIVEVLAGGAQPAPVILLGAAMLEFALLISLTRRRRPPAAREPTQS